MKAMPCPRRWIALPFTALLGGCGWLTPYPDHRLTYKKSAWGTVQRETPYVLLKEDAIEPFVGP